MCTDFENDRQNLLVPNFRSTAGCVKYGGADKSLARPGRKQATATEDFEFHISYL